MTEQWQERREAAEPWTRYPLADEDWALLEAEGWQVAIDRARFTANTGHKITWTQGWEDDHLAFSWVCSCGAVTGHNFPSESAVLTAAGKHLDFVEGRIR